ncbi:MAG: glycerate kinase [Bacteroidota bacterium]
MKILIAPDKFKGSLSAMEVCEAIGNGFLKSGKAFDLDYHPIADGGDGSVEVLVGHLDLQARVIDAQDPLGRGLRATYFTSANAAFIEVAAASGLVLLSEKERNPLLTSTTGSGKMVVDAIQKGFKTIYLFLGGSSTNDGGMGIAAELGFEFIETKGNGLKPIGENLSLVEHISYTPKIDLTEVKLILLCDVVNPLFGPNGAAHVYAPQKGANPHQVSQLDTGLRHFSQALMDKTKKDISQLPGSGAAGGIAASLVALLDASIESGFETISRLTKLEAKIETADLIISGEGKLDTQSYQGKVVGEISKLASKHQKPVALFVGKNDLGAVEILQNDPIQVSEILSLTTNEQDAFKNAAQHLEMLAYDFAQKNI